MPDQIKPSNETGQPDLTSRQKARSNRRFSRRAMLKGALAATALAGSAGSAIGDGISARVAFNRAATGSCNTPLKQRATNDYRTSLAQYGGRLSTPTRQLFITAEQETVHFGVAVIGSGYGAAIAASRISQHLRDEHRICILERGKEWIPGTFPDTASEIFGPQQRNMMAGPSKGSLNNPLGLFNIMMNDEVNILGGNGLGGSSLINASIALRPHHEVFQRNWPAALSHSEVLAPYYDRVARAMSLSRTPFDQTPKVRARRIAAERLSSSPELFDRSHIQVMYDYRHLDQQMRNPQGMIQRPCTLCGDCATGCNVGAKNTLQYNYLPVARHNGTEMYTQVEVTSIVKKCGYYQINMVYIDDSEGKITRHPVSINSRIVVVGAGSPGTPGILMQSQKEGSMCFSPALGTRWSGNGDTIGFVIDMQGPTNIGGHGTYEPLLPGGVGPTVQTSLNFYREGELGKRLLIQDAGIPRGVTKLFRVLLGDPDLNNSMAMLGMGHDGAGGSVVWKDGRWQVKWEGLKESAYRKMVFGEFDRLARAHGGTYKRLKAFGDNLVTVHPLGGCPMGDDPRFAATNHLGQVYDGRHGGYSDPTGMPAVHHGLYVSDASLVPTALGVNPYMTIAALAERMSRHIVNDPNHAELFAS
ncbi:MAG: GMC family oxidoreductase N-terminal domain-containing protein [Planctomycetota bacterium]